MPYIVGAINIVEYYRDHPVEFSEDCLGFTCTWQQAEILNSLRDHKFVAVASGRGIGKSLVAAIAIIWFLCTRSMPQVPITAPSSASLNDVLFARLNDCFNKLSPVFKSQFEITSDRIYHKLHKKNWFAVGRTARKENPESIQGFHSENMLLVVDEAAGVDAKILESALGSFTQEENYALLISNPNRLSGVFYDLFNTKNSWKTLSYSSIDSPIASREFINNMKEQYGVDSPVYQVNVLGRFPDSEESSFISVGSVMDAIERQIEKPTGQEIWGLDVARFGDDSSCLCKRKGNKIHYLEKITKRDTMHVAGFVAAEYRNAKEKPIRICVDVIGVGAGVADRLRELGLPVTDVNVANSADEPDKYLRLRDQLWGLYRDWLKEEVSIPDIRELVMQTTAIRFKYDSSGKICIERKEDFKKRNAKIGSPDLADSVCLTFYNHKQKVYDVVF